MAKQRKPKKEVFSYGGGIQSVAISVLIAKGLLPKPDHIVMCDTGREASKVWEYLDKYVQPMLKKVGLQVEIAPHSLANRDLYSPSGDLLIPAFTRHATDYVPDFLSEDGKIGRLRTFCSSEWKAAVFNRYMRRVHGLMPKYYTCWLGFSTDEARRRKPHNPSRVEYRYPLLDDLPMSREKCKQVIINYGLPLPNKSACWMCPLRIDKDWIELKENSPEDFEKAIKFEKEIREKDPLLFLHKTAIPLEKVKFKVGSEEENANCESGHCYI